MITEKRYLDTVTIVIPMYNEEKYIEGLVDSILNQDYDKEKIEVIFIDGKSEDKTVEKLKSALEGKVLKYILMYNPERITPKSVNMGIKSAKNDIIIRLDAHSKYPNNYVSKCVYYLNNTDADNVGCLFAAKGKTKKGKAIANVVSSRFGVGNSCFRTKAESGYVDTVPYGTFRKELFEKIGYFNEELIRSEDNEFNHRIKKNGGKVYLFNEVEIEYYPRDTIKKIMKMGYQNGEWAIYTGYIIPGSMKLRHFIPLMFVLSLIIGIIICLLNIKFLKIMFLCEIGLYLILDLIFSLKSIKSGILQCILCFIIYPLFHIAYGVGSIAGIGKILKKKVKKIGRK